MIAPQFFSVGKNGKFNLQDFTGMGDGASWGIYINVIDRLGGFLNAYVWVEDYGDNGNQKCWLDCDTYELPKDQVSFEPGHAFWVEAQNDYQKIQSSGEVPVNDAVVQLCDGMTLAGNFTPTKMSLQDIYCEGEGSSWSVYLDVVDRLGGIEKAYVWVEDYGENNDQKCWLDCDTYELPEQDVMFDPGQAFRVEAQSNKQFIVFAGVEL